MADMVYVPFPRELYNDLVRFSDGRIDPAEWAADRLEAWIEHNFSSLTNGLGWASDSFMANFEDRIEEFAEKYYPAALTYWANELDRDLEANQAKRRPLIWKEITVPASSEVRMTYGGSPHYGLIYNGKIKDSDGEFSPSEWASKIAGGTSRNAWRDIWFKTPTKPTWTPATVLREEALVSRKGTLEAS